MKKIPALAVSTALIVAACSAGTAPGNAAPADSARIDTTGDHPAKPLTDVFVASENLLTVLNDVTGTYAALA